MASLFKIAHDNTKLISRPLKEFVNREDKRLPLPGKVVDGTYGRYSFDLSSGDIVQIRQKTFIIKASICGEEGEPPDLTFPEDFDGHLEVVPDQPSSLNCRTVEQVLEGALPKYIIPSIGFEVNRVKVTPGTRLQVLRRVVSAIGQTSLECTIVDSRKKVNLPCFKVGNFKLIWERDYVKLKDIAERLPQKVKLLPRTAVHKKESVIEGLPATFTGMLKLDRVEAVVISILDSSDKPFIIPVDTEITLEDLSKESYTNEDFNPAKNIHDLILDTDLPVAVKITDEADGSELGIERDMVLEVHRKQDVDAVVGVTDKGENLLIPLSIDGRFEYVRPVYETAEDLRQKGLNKLVEVTRGYEAEHKDLSTLRSGDLVQAQHSLYRKGSDFEVLLLKKYIIGSKNQSYCKIQIPLYAKCFFIERALPEDEDTGTLSSLVLRGLPIQVQLIEEIRGRSGKILKDQTSIHLLEEITYSAFVAHVRDDLKKGPVEVPDFLEIFCKPWKTSQVQRADIIHQPAIYKLSKQQFETLINVSDYQILIPTKPHLLPRDPRSDVQIPEYDLSDDEEEPYVRPVPDPNKDYTGPAAWVSPKEGGKPKRGTFGKWIDKKKRRASLPANFSDQLNLPSSQTDMDKKGAKMKVPSLLKIFRRNSMMDKKSACDTDESDDSSSDYEDADNDKPKIIEKGSHLMRHIILHVLNDGDEKKVLNDNRGRSIEMAVAGEGDDPRIVYAKKHITGDNYIEKMESPRFFFTHLRQEFLPKELDKQKPRIIYIARNPKDALVSYIHLARHMPVFKNTDVTVETFLQKLVDGVPCGKYCLYERCVVTEPNFMVGDHRSMISEMNVSKSERQLLNTDFFYQELEGDTTEDVQREIMDTVNAFISAGELPTEARNLIVRRPRTAVFYLLPKIHKVNIPGRPIVSACNCPAEHIACYLDALLRPIVAFQPTYINDTNHALKILNGFQFQQAFSTEDYGTWNSHVICWWNKRNEDNVLFLKYEDVVRDLKGNVKNVAKFLGKDLPDSVIDKIADLCSLEKMKQNSNARSDATCRMMHIDPEDSPFVRRGKVGGWKEYFTVAQSELLDQTYSKWMEGTDLQLEFE
ncbi:uncharacterized protein LOC144445330 [Glandiceps talaboti]